MSDTDVEEAVKETTEPVASEKTKGEKGKEEEGIENKDSDSITM